MVLTRFQTTIKSHIQPHQPAWLIIAVFALIYGLIAFVNHHLFKTFALDLGVYTNALYDYAHGQFNDKSVFKPIAENLLSDHFDLYLIAFSPLSYLLGEYTLQTIQIVFILSGSLGLYKLIELKSGNKILALTAQLSLLLSFAVFASLSFDYHSNVPAVMLLPWIFLAAEKNKPYQLALLIALVCIAKESLPLMMFFVCLGMAIEYRGNTKIRQTSVLMALVCISYFLLVMKVIMPALANSGTYEHFKYHALGNNYGDALMYVFQHPLEFIQTLFNNHSGKPEFDYVKAETYAFLLVSGAWLMVWRPAFLVMSLPLLVMKMCYDDPAIWSIDTHYSIEFAPILAIGAYFAILKTRGPFLQYMFALLMVMGCLSATLRYMDNTVYWHDYSRVRLYQKSHYVKNYDVNVVHQQLDRIPKDAVVSAQTPFVPHLAYRDKCYTFPIVKEAEYIIVSPKEEAMYPIIREEMDQQISDTLQTGRWKRHFSDSNILILKRLK